MHYSRIQKQIFYLRMPHSCPCCRPQPDNKAGIRASKGTILPRFSLYGADFLDKSLSIFQVFLNTVRFSQDLELHLDWIKITVAKKNFVLDQTLKTSYINNE